jgi:hypothetical protein
VRQGQPEGSVSDSDLLVLTPWAVFALGVALLVVRTVTRRDGPRRGRGAAGAGRLARKHRFRR